MQAQQGVSSRPNLIIQSYIKHEKISQSEKNKTEISDLSTKGNNTVKAEQSGAGEDTGSKSPPGKLSVTKHELHKYKRKRKFSCKICGTVAGSRKEIIDHHKASHKKCYCNKCGKACNTPSTLEWHLYSHHDELPFACADCDAKFAFAGQLKQH